ncbi:hypothetical protein BDV30DRAFT_95195 [Aspergillus minisclerotigenes]|uniref:Uncharacterized protein n=1 Tax=Aspergillus minisclerotigenes TaxID=656917 RepID=A0A5N6J6A0_9EURO|nr:hypothetical protein BDV30DRAFT_95195 [Aspergillus minisclerotigenes]
MMQFKCIYKVAVLTQAGRCISVPDLVSPAKLSKLIIRPAHELHLPVNHSQSAYYPRAPVLQQVRLCSLNVCHYYILCVFHLQPCLQVMHGGVYTWLRDPTISIV